MMPYKGDEESTSSGATRALTDSPTFSAEQTCNEILEWVRNQE